MGGPSPGPAQWRPAGPVELQQHLVMHGTVPSHGHQAGLEEAAGTSISLKDFISTDNMWLKEGTVCLFVCLFVCVRYTVIGGSADRRIGGWEDGRMGGGRIGVS
jgi:hypothetical protein